MQFPRRRAVFAVLAMFVALLVIASPMAENERVPSVMAPSGHDADLRVATSSPTTASATAPTRRLLSVDSFVGYLHVAQSVAITLLLWIAAAMGCWAFLVCVGLTRRVRAPPLVRA